jgi:predicted dehydrogenase
MIGVGVIGYGYWGPNLVRNFAEAPGARVVAISDFRPERRDAARARYPAVAISADPAELIRDPAVAAVAIATPVSTHFDFAMRALRAGKHVLVEKPLAASSAQAERLVDEAGRRGVVLAVDHTFIYTAAVRKIRELAAAGDLGEIYYYDSTRVNLGLFQSDVDVTWDLAVHDLAILDYLTAASPRAVSATGMSHVPERPGNIAYLTLFFDDRLIAHVHVNWLSPVKIRRALIGGSRKMIVYDDLELTEKVKVYDRGIILAQRPDSENLYRMLIGYRMGDMWSPRLELTEALRVEVLEFLDCIETGGRPASDGESGLRVVRTLEAVSASMACGGRPVELTAGGAAR